MKGNFNLSEWAIKHQSFVWYLMFVALLMGVFSYMKLGREEDPSFTIKTMIIQTRWPGATVDETLKQVTDRIEKKLEELDSLDYVKSYTRPGESTVFVYLRDTTSAKAIPEIWYQVRKKVDDIRGQFRRGCKARRSTTSLAMCTARSMRLPQTVSRCVSCVTTSRRSAPTSATCPGWARSR